LPIAVFPGRLQRDQACVHAAPCPLLSGCRLNRHLAHRLAGDNDMMQRLIGACGSPPRLPARDLNAGIAPCDNRCRGPGSHTDQRRHASSGGGRGDQASPALPTPALFDNRPQSQQNRPGGLFHVRHWLRLQLQGCVDHQPVRSLCRSGIDGRHDSDRAAYHHGRFRMSIQSRWTSYSVRNAPDQSESH
jgi:hypothetical protein